MNIKTSNKIWLSQATDYFPEDKPVVFWDTCALLDILRIPLRERVNLSKRTLEEYEKIEEWIATGRLISVTAELVVKEFGEHADDVVKQLSIQERKTKEDVREQADYMLNGVQKTKITNGIDLLDIQSRVKELVKKIWRHTLVLRSQKSFASNADYRVRNYIKPSGGKESYKDCYLWSSYITLMTTIASTEPCFLFTTNPSDFAENKGSVELHPSLKAELPNTQTDCVMKMDILFGNLISYFRPAP